MQSHLICAFRICVPRLLVVHAGQVELRCGALGGQPLRLLKFLNGLSEISLPLLNDAQQDMGIDAGGSSVHVLQRQAFGEVQIIVAKL